MQMPNRNSIDGSYRYAYQGQEKDPETGKEAFQLRLYDSRINRWLTTDPYNQYHSPYVAMGNDPINGIDPDGGYRTWFGALGGWIAGGFQGSIRHTDNGGNQDYSVYKGAFNNDGTAEGFSGTFEYSHHYGSDYVGDAWNSRFRRNLTGDAIGFSGGWEGGAFIGVGSSVDVNWILTGKDASFFPYIGATGKGTLGDGVNVGIDISASRLYYTGSVDEVTAKSITGNAYGISVGGKIVVGGGAGVSYSPDGDTGNGWIQVSANLGVGVELSPATAANVQVEASHTLWLYHTGSGKFIKSDFIE